MLRAVFDTNVLVSSLIRPGKPRELWNKVLQDEVKLVISDELLSEFSEVIARPEFKRYLRKPRTAKFQRILIQRSQISRVKIRFPQVTEDPDDNIVLEAAHSGKADYIVSGDKRLLALKDFKEIKIVTVDETLRILKR